jgi:hypothetical protein
MGLIAYVLQTRVKWSAFKQWLFLGVLLLPLNAIRAVAVERFPSFRLTALTESIGMKGVAVLALIVAVAVIALRRPLANTLPSLLVIFAVFFPLNALLGLRMAASYNPALFADKPLAPRQASARTSPRIVWVIFDEWDQRLTFLNRNPSIQMPELDRFRLGSLYAANAYPPTSQTAWSLPVLTTGILAPHAEVDGPDELMLTLPETKKKIRWQDAPNIFAEARAAGYNVGVVGFYHPYCRIFNTSLSACNSWPTALEYNSLGTSFFEVIPNQLRSLVETDSRSLFGQSLAVRRHGEVQRESLALSEKLVSDPEMGMVFLHLAVPHAPYAYDRRTGQFTSHSPKTGYWDNLVLLDHIVGTLRADMERANLWDGTTVLLSADHFNRASPLLDGKIDHRVPFLLKLAGQHEGLTFDRPFNTYLTHDLIQAVMHGEVTDPGAAAEWLDRHRTIADSPYNTDFIP